jgi:hypothetical protein
LYISVVVVGLAVPLRRWRGKEYTLVPIGFCLLLVVLNIYYIPYVPYYIFFY